MKITYYAKCRIDEYNLESYSGGYGEDTTSISSES